MKNVPFRGSSATISRTLTRYFGDSNENPRFENATTYPITPLAAEAIRHRTPSRVPPRVPADPRWSGSRRSRRPARRPRGWVLPGRRGRNSRRPTRRRGRGSR